ncbi:uncharacterized protein Triagg1_5259 [Trichoderma aggressivum f. europaeum]|uniref:Uncharacterized protein n=1 Tax=Trichoderma aggressivum f. europaeum TaxID=173218 RepID=A0AAE1M2U1_9HYPO|nr:hypothetical protein Triagg1_5259 [Trichoderma aggressivum f. europaeum]
MTIFALSDNLRIWSLGDCYFNGQRRVHHHEDGCAAWLALSAGCSHEKHDEREWTKEELAELEAKWGFDGRMVVYWVWIVCAPGPCQVPNESRREIRHCRCRGAVRHGRELPSRRAFRAQSYPPGFIPRANINPYRNWAKVVDCGDIPITPFDNDIAREQMTQAFKEAGREGDCVGAEFEA